MRMGIPVNIPPIPKNAIAYVTQTIEKNWISSLCLDESVNYIDKLEKGFSEFVGSKFGVTATSGTAALDLAVAALSIGPGDEVIVPTFTMIATAACVIRNGAQPVFVDSDPDTWCIDAKRIEAAITEKTKAIIPVHIYGYPADMDTILRIAERYNLLVIEDAAEAIGTLYKGKMAGGIGHIGCFSFYANKTMTCGEGGMLVTNDSQIARRAAMLKDQAFGHPRFIHEEIGFNYRMSNLTAAYAFASFEEVNGYIQRKLDIAGLYHSLLSNVEGLVLPPSGDTNIKSTYWMYGILLNKAIFGRAKQEVRDLLQKEFKVDTRDFFFPMHRQPVMITKGFVDHGFSAPVADHLWESGFYLPSGVTLSHQQIEFVCNALKSLKR
jgi:perosamine synthetase